MGIMKDYAQQSGNALVMVLIITGLFAMLTIVVSNSFDGTASLQYSRKQIESGIQDMLRYGANLENTAYQMVQINNIDLTTLDFRSDQDSPATLHQNTNCTSSICRVFETGGGIKRRHPPAAVVPDPSASAYIFSGTSPVYGHGLNTDADLFMSVEVTQNACKTALDMLSIPLTADAPPDDDFVNTSFTGAFSTTAGQEIDHADLSGLKAFCFRDIGDDAYYFVYVLYPR